MWGCAEDAHVVGVALLSESALCALGVRSGGALCAPGS
jgi:hypothetical protein